MKKIYTGIESSGKSLALAKDVKAVIRRNGRWLKKTGIPRPIISNMVFSGEIQKMASERGIPIIYYTDLVDVIYRTECDVFMDEILKYFDARNWENLSIDAKHWLTQGAKTGVHLYGAAQDMSQVDKSFRLLINKCYHVVKIIGSPRPMKTAPRVKRVWGFCLKYRVDPQSFTGDSVTMKQVGLPRVMLITRRTCSVFDTGARVVPSAPPPLKHIARVCMDPKCGYCRVTHV